MPRSAPSSGALSRLEQVADDARDYAAHAKAPNTLKWAYPTLVDIPDESG
jgi:hypothetical protein